MTASRRLVAALHVRQLALTDATDLEQSRALLAELSELLRTYYRRALVDIEVGGERQTIETSQRVGPAELRVWWLEHQHGLVELHRELARSHLVAAGVEA